MVVEVIGELGEAGGGGGWSENARGSNRI